MHKEPIIYRCKNNHFNKKRLRYIFQAEKDYTLDEEHEYVYQVKFKESPWCINLEELREHFIRLTPEKLFHEKMESILDEV